MRWLITVFYFISLNSGKLRFLMMLLFLSDRQFRIHFFLNPFWSTWDWWIWASSTYAAQIIIQTTSKTVSTSASTFRRLHRLILAQGVFKSSWEACWICIVSLASLSRFIESRSTTMSGALAFLWMLCFQVGCIILALNIHHFLIGHIIYGINLSSQWVVILLWSR